MFRGKYSDDVEQVHVNRSGKQLVVVFSTHILKMYDVIKVQVIQVLCKKYERDKNEKRQEIKPLSKPTGSDRACDLPLTIHPCQVR